MELKDYLEADTGFVSNQKNPGYKSCENGILFTCRYLNMGWLTHSFDKETQELILKFRDTISKCWLAPGLLQRHPDGHRIEAHDDYVGIISCEVFATSRVREFVYTYGEKHKGSFNSETPGKFSLRTFFYRFFYFRPLLKAANNIELSWYDIFTTTMEYLICCLTPTRDTNGRCLLLDAAMVFRWCSSRIIRFGIGVFLWDIKRRYKNISGLYSIYFGPEHPITILAAKLPDDWYKK